MLKNTVGTLLVMACFTVACPSQHMQAADMELILDRIAPLGADVHYAVERTSWRWSAEDGSVPEAEIEAWHALRVALSSLRPGREHPSTGIDSGSQVPSVETAVESLQRREASTVQRSLVTAVGLTSLQRPHDQVQIATVRTMTMAASLQRLQVGRNDLQLSILPRQGGFTHDEPYIAFAPMPVVEPMRKQLATYEWRLEDQANEELSCYVGRHPQAGTVVRLVVRVTDGVPVEAAQWNKDESWMTWVSLIYPDGAGEEFWPIQATQVTVTANSSSIDRRNLSDVVLGVDPREMTLAVPAGTNVYDQRAGLDVRLGRFEDVWGKLPEVLRQHMYVSDPAKEKGK